MNTDHFTNISTRRGAPELVGEQKRKLARPTSTVKTGLFKESKTSESKTGILWLIWVILEWIGGFLVKYTAPTPIPETSKAKFKKYRKKKPETDYISTLGFTPAVRRQKPPL